MAFNASDCVRMAPGPGHAKSPRAHRNPLAKSTVNNKSLRNDDEGEQPSKRRAGNATLSEPAIDAPPLSSDDEDSAAEHVSKSLSQSGNIKPSFSNRNLGAARTVNATKDDSSSRNQKSKRNEKATPSSAPTEKLGSHLDVFSQASRKTKRNAYGNSSQTKVKFGKSQSSQKQDEPSPKKRARRTDDDTDSDSSGREFKGISPLPPKADTPERPSFMHPSVKHGQRDGGTPPRTREIKVSPAKSASRSWIMGSKQSSKSAKASPTKDSTVKAKSEVDDSSPPPKESTKRPGFKNPMLRYDFLGSSQSSAPESPEAKLMMPSSHISPLKDEEPGFSVPSIPKTDEPFDNELPDLTHVTTSELKKRAYQEISKHTPDELKAIAEELLEKAEQEISMSPNQEALSTQDPEDTAADTKSIAVCPMCGDEVDHEFLRDYSGGVRMDIRKQDRFCRAHKKRSAYEEWSLRKYPTIDWDGLDDRIQKHHEFLKRILDGGTSYYRNVLQDSVKSGQNRTIRQGVFNSEHSLTPGYYGPRGLRAMSENIMARFSPQLRRIAIKDRLVSARGVSGYVQSVLVPELAVRLIGEDMGVDIEEVREVMRDSIGLGELLNDEVDEVVILTDEHFEETLYD